MVVHFCARANFGPRGSAWNWDYAHGGGTCQPQWHLRSKLWRDHAPRACPATLFCCLCGLLKSLQALAVWALVRLGLPLCELVTVGGPRGDLGPC